MADRAPMPTRRTMLAGAAALPAVVAACTAGGASPAVAEASSPLLQLEARYSALSAELNAIPDTDEREAHFTEAYVRLDKERCGIATRLVAMPASTDPERRAKARCAADWFSGYDDDLGDCLVASLLVDLGGERPWLEHLLAHSGAPLAGGGDALNLAGQPSAVALWRHAQAVRLQIDCSPGDVSEEESDRLAAADDAVLAAPIRTAADAAAIIRCAAQSFDAGPLSSGNDESALGRAVAWLEGQ